jgi:hypothetical protein
LIAVQGAPGEKDDDNNDNEVRIAFTRLRRSIRIYSLVCLKCQREGASILLYLLPMNVSGSLCLVVLGGSEYIYI